MQSRSRYHAATVLALLAALAPVALAYEIGHTSATYIDPARENRQVGVEIYYPATVAGDDVPVAPPPAGGFPPIAFGHGYMMAYDDYDYVWTALVPAGFILALPRTEGGLFPSHDAFGKDLAFLVRKIQQEGENPASAFYGAVATTCAVMGHSMGGGASVLAAAEDPAITALANLAAAETSPSAIVAAAGITAPVLMFAGSNDCVAPPSQHQIPIYQALGSDCKALVTITGASHCQFAEYDYLCGLGEGGCSPPGLTREAQHAIVVRLLRPWLDFVLREDGSAWAEYQARLAEAEGFTFVQDCDAVTVEEEPARRDATSGADLRLAGVKPNPFVHRARIALEARHAGWVSVEILSPAGACVSRLTALAAAPGALTLEWNGRDAQGRLLPTGVYFARAAGTSESMRLILTR
jgi:pimeloyl-ACP methyl ester carboxylesterase